jgi:hypothetical protein
MTRPSKHVNRTVFCYVLLCISIRCTLHKIPPQKTAGYMGVRRQMSAPYDVEMVIARTIELLDGPDRARAVTDAEFGDMVTRWDQDVDAMVRILRSHLYVEHCLTEFICHANPRLGSISEARLTFNQKLALLDTKSPGVAELKPGIAQLNKIRNRLAHRLSSELLPAEAQVFLAAPMFSSMRFVALGHSPKTLAPLEILEQFALYSANILAGEFSSFSKAFGQALEESKV